MNTISIQSTIPVNTVLVTREEVNAMLGISDTTRQRLEKADKAFPAKIKVSARRVAFRKVDVLAYIDRQYQAAVA